MKKYIVLKSLLDVFLMLFYALLGVIGIAVLFLDASPHLKLNDLSLNEMHIFHIILLIVKGIGAILFLVSIYYLKKIANLMGGADNLKEEICTNIHSAAWLLIISGVLSLLTSMVSWIYETVTAGKVNVALNMAIFLIFMKLIFGVFLFIQEDYIRKAKMLKQENDLTI